MFEDIKNKLEKDNNCNLSVDELKILYKVDISDYDTYQYMEISKYINDRNIYDDLVKVFGKKYVARTPNELNMDTICFVGSLTIKEIIPTYNLRYIYGDLYHYLENALNLENLELINGAGMFLNLKRTNGLENLEIIKGETYFANIESAEGLNSLKITGLANFEKLRNSKGLENLEIINGNANFKLLQNAKGLISLRKIYRNANFTVLKSSKGLEKLEYIGGEAVFRYLENAEGLCNLKDIKSTAFFESLKDSKGLESLKSIGGSCFLYSLTNFNNFKSLEYIGGFLSIDCKDNSILYFLNKVYGITVDNVEKIAFNSFDLNDNTEILITNLNVFSSFQFNSNLKYIIGDLTCGADKLTEPKEIIKVFGSAKFKNLKSAEGLENLEYIGKNAIFSSLESLEGLDNLKYIGQSQQFGNDELTLEEFKNSIKIKKI